jgi:hypothetical protein
MLLIGMERMIHRYVFFPKFSCSEASERMLIGDCRIREIGQERKSSSSRLRYVFSRSQCTLVPQSTRQA